MASVVTEIAAALLIFTCVVQGARSLQIEHVETLSAVVGQNVSLPCIVAEKHEVNINQIEWDVKIKDNRERLVVFSPQYRPHYFEPVYLELVNRTNSTILRGSILHLYNVTKKDSGTYFCYITTFPYGSYQNSTVVQVTDPWISAEVVSPGESLIEGDEVNITCVSSPPADRYMLSSLQNGLLLESKSGHFTIQSVTRHSGDLICQPSNQQSLQANLRMTVDYIDSIKCNSSTQLEVETGTNLTITCETTSSRPLSYTWRKGNKTVSQNTTVSLWSVTPEQAGTYSVIIYARNHSRLQRQRDFVVTVLNRTDADQLSSTIETETTWQITNATTLTTAGPGTITTVTQPSHTTSTTENSLYYNTTAPSAGDISTLQANITSAQAKITRAPANFTRPHANFTRAPANFTRAHANFTRARSNNTVKSNATWSISLNTSAEGSTLSEGCCQWHNTTSSLRSTRVHQFTSAQPITSTNSFTATSTMITKKTVEVEKSGSMVVVFVLIPILLLLVLIGFLYRRYRIQKRMDMPPPFKPPPPPVKYTSVRSQDIPVTDILV
ncbi:T-cell surface protein tactile [Astyanax mexicanus]|uniref:T-cell surface protein tactile n=1 Tax=Astyanax mexicanus TaxID=7994 RepID=A0A8T2KWI4_ASTMX|nr:T-cell surface protein tactile [Astyanax mexicanus]